MLGPLEDWQEYDWRVIDAAAAAAPGFTFIEKTARIWRVTMTAGGAGGTVAFSSTGIITLAANETRVVEPRGMFVAPITAIGVHVTIEWIRRITEL